jgi:hypothetical protein
MKQSAREIIMEGNEGYQFRDVIDNLTEQDILSCMEEYAKQQQGYSKEDMLNFAWFLIENIGQYSCDRTAHFEGKYLEQFKNK